MSMTLKEQLANLPVPRLTTVVRMSIRFADDQFSFERTWDIVRNWWNEKAKPYDLSIENDTSDLSFSRLEFKAELARTEDSVAFAMEEPDSGVEGRSWIVDVALRREADKGVFSLRASYRQPYNAKSRPERPEPRAPRFLRQIVDEVGPFDVWPVKSHPSEVDAASLPSLIELLESDRRTLPVVVVSEDVQSGLTLVDPERLAWLLAGAAHVVRLKSEASWGLSTLWGKEWSAYLGAIRCYVPKLDRGGDKFRHRLWNPETILRLDANFRNGFLNTITEHVFTQITAEFEPWPLLTPSIVRRELKEVPKTTGSLSEETLKPIPEAQHEAEAAQFALSPTPASVELPTPSKDLNQAKVIELEATVADLAKNLKRQEDVAKRIEADLEQERAGRAETERKLVNAEAEIRLFEEENTNLERERALAFGDASRERSEALRPVWQNFSGLFSAVNTMAIQFRRMEDDSNRLYELEEDLANAKRDIANLRATIDSLNRRATTSECGWNSTEILFRKELLEIVPQMARHDMTLRVILDLIGLVFPDRVTVLTSAFESATDADSFQHCEQAFDLLWTLATQYWEAIQQDGDVEARKLFGKSYAAKEKTALSKAGRERRKFTYNGNEILMEKHLKIGTADNPSDTLRVHFEWIAEEKRIVIGHCGRHLDF